MNILQELNQNKVVVVTAATNSALDFKLKTMLHFLSQDERQEAGRILSYARFSEYLCARIMLRFILTDFLGYNLGDIKIEYGQYGKPFLRDLDVQFNITHSNGLVAIAFCKKSIGIDIEYLDAGKDIECMARALEKDNKGRAIDFTALYKDWTRREAVLKAIGCGFGVEESKESGSGYTVQALGIEARNYVGHIAHNSPIPMDILHFDFEKILETTSHG